MYRVLTFTSLFPNVEQPRHGIFIETRLRKLVETGEVDARVVAPVPWFPFTSKRMGRFASYGRVPVLEQRDGMEVHHPRFLSVPGLPKRTLPHSMALASLPTLRRLQGGGFDFDVIDAHFYYPDGIAAALLGKWLKKPVVITARGSDITYWPSQPGPRRMILWAARQAHRNAGVSQALVDEMARLGCAADSLIALRNGVDLQLFHQEERAPARATLDLHGIVALSVGNLVELKGHHLAIEAIAGIPDASLVIIGAGPEETRLRELVSQLGVGARVRFVGVVPQTTLRRYYSAADVLILASSREGWPNVLLESMACGTPVVATQVWGIPEIVTAPEAGELVFERSAAAVRAAVMRLLARDVDRSATRAYAERFGWEETSRAQLDMFEQVLREAAPAGVMHRYESSR